MIFEGSLNSWLDNIKYFNMPTEYFLDKGLKKLIHRLNKNEEYWPRWIFIIQSVAAPLLRYNINNQTFPLFVWSSG